MLDIDRRSYNGRISRSELDRLLTSRRFEDQKFKGFAAFLRANFSWFDTDHSGQISMSELRQAVVDYLHQGHVPPGAGVGLDSVGDVGMRTMIAPMGVVGASADI